MTTALFAPEEKKIFGVRGANHRYHMPLLPGEEGPKSGGEWIPWGMQSMTNLASSISDTKALGRWEREQSQIGLVLRPDVMEELSILVNQARLNGVDFGAIKDHPDLRAELERIHEQCKTASGANAARQAGTNRHTVWEARGAHGQLIGTPAINAEIGVLEQLIAAAGFVRIPELSERVVRNCAVNAAGRFDDILLHERDGYLAIADLKTKRKPFWTWLEMDAQLAGYARSEWMLSHVGTDAYYQPGPVHHVRQDVGVILHMPSDGGEPRLRKADLEEGWRTLQLAREVCTQRSGGRSAKRERESYWPVS